jgi:hypothetical protein
MPPGRLHSKADQIKDVVNIRALVYESMYGNRHTTAGG